MMANFGYAFVRQSRRIKAAILIGADVCFAVLALWLAFSLRLGEWYKPVGIARYLFLLAPLLAVPIFIRLGLYRAIIRYIEVRALWTIIQAVTLYASVFAAFYFLPFIVYESGIRYLPRTVPPLNWLIMMLLVGSSRFFARWWLGDIYFHVSGERNPLEFRKRNVVIYGAGNAGVQLASALSHGREYRPVAFIDDEEQLHKRKINGLKIYPFSSLSFLIGKHHVSDVLLAMPSAKRARKLELIGLLEPYAVHVMSMPGLADIAQGKVTFDTLQEVDIVDLLGRDPVAPDQSLLHADISGKIVLVTGAGGSIGSELCRQILLLQPKVLILYEISEYALYLIDKELSLELDQVVSGEKPEMVALLGSVADGERLRKVCQSFSVQTIFHAAAYKHVPMVESNPGEAIRNNVFGTLAAAQAAIAAKVATFVLISTDKAVRPTNTMGATKRVAELILQALSVDYGIGHQTRFTMVRFGNVLGSSGSVVPLFREQIARGGPVTVTDERIIRYFMTIPEAAQLVIQAGAMGNGGDVFVLDMGEPIRIFDLARRMIHLSGLEIKDEEHPNGEIEICFTGLRPGEKLYEELLIGDNVSNTGHPRIMRAEEHVIPWPELEPLLLDMEKSARDDDYESVRTLLAKAVSGFAPQCPIADALWKKQRLNG